MVELENPINLEEGSKEQLVCCLMGKMIKDIIVQENYETKH